MHKEFCLSVYFTDEILDVRKHWAPSSDLTGRENWFHFCLYISLTVKTQYQPPMLSNPPSSIHSQLYTLRKKQVKIKGRISIQELVCTWDALLFQFSLSSFGWIQQSCVWLWLWVSQTLSEFSKKIIDWIRKNQCIQSTQMSCCTVQRAIEPLSNLFWNSRSRPV